MSAIRAWLIRLLGVRECGAFGGMVEDGQRWCTKAFGHSDSCFYEVTPSAPWAQPGFNLRRHFRGWPPM